MFDFTPLSRGVGFLFLAYFAAFPVGAVASAVVEGVTHRRSFGLSFMLVYPPWVFGVAALVLAVDFFRRLGAGALSSSQVTGYRAAGVFAFFGTAFGLQALPDHPTWIPVAVAVLACVLMMLPTRGKATPSTWKPR